MDSATATTSWEGHDEWELHNDDGFVYKRKKRLLHTSVAQPPPSTDAGEAAAEAEDRKRERRKRTLLKLKVKYQNEILQWETLSDILRAMQERALQLQRKRERTPPLASPSETIKVVDSDGGSLLDELLLQVEAQEAIIHDVSNLCDVAEAMCLKQKEQFKQLFFNLPIWASQHELMELLCDD